MKHENVWTCYKCGMQFSTRAQLRTHSKIHPNNQGWAKGLTKASDKRVAKSVKNRKINPATGRINNGCYGKHLSEQTKQKQRIAMCNWLNSLPVNKRRANYNPNAIPILEQIAKEHDWNIQHAMNGGEFYTGIGYFVDAYDKEKNIVLEYDEPVHYVDVENNVLREKDLKRQQEIIEHLHCEYWRYNEKMKLLWKV